MALNNFENTQPKNIIFVTVFLLFFAFFIYFFVFNNTFSTIYVAKDSTDLTEILKTLTLQNIEYKTDNNKILVSKKDFKKLSPLIKNIYEKYNSNSLVGYEIFDKEENFSFSNTNKEINFIRALEGELSRSITSLDSIKKARVHIVLPKKQTLLKNQINASASVILTLQNNNLTEKEINAISNLVSTSVPGLENKNISIISTEGRAYKTVNNDVGDEILSTKIQEYKFLLENRLKKNIKNLLEKVVGPGNIEAEVFVDLDFSKTEINSESYDPSSATVRSLHKSEENNNDNLGAGRVSISETIPNSFSNKINTNEDYLSSNKNELTKNFEISKEIKKQIIGLGNIKRLSIAVLINNKIEELENEKINYCNKSTDQIENLSSLVKSAVGFNENRGDKIDFISINFKQNTMNNLNDFFSKKIKLEKKEVFFENYNKVAPILKTIIYSIAFLLFSIFVLKPVLEKFINLISSIVNNFNKKKPDNSNSEPKNFLSYEEKLNQIVSNNTFKIKNILENWMNKSDLRREN